MNRGNRPNRPRAIMPTRARRYGRLHYGCAGALVMTAVLFGIAVVTLILLDLCDDIPLAILDNEMKIATIILAIAQLLSLFVIYVILLASSSSQIEWMKCGLRFLSILLAVTIGCSILFAADTVNGIKDGYIKNINKGIKKYPTDKDMAANIDVMQRMFSCCGIKNYSDWAENEKYQCPISNESDICRFPASCCEKNPLHPRQHGCFIVFGSLNFSTASVVETKTENGTLTFFTKTVKRKFHNEGCFKKANDAVKKFGIGVLINSVISMGTQIMIIAATILFIKWSQNNRRIIARRNPVIFRAVNGEVNLPL